ncbi:conserved hypothetical protein [Arboricoccus pini]|uniref:Transmembrane protein (Alph_Pro_TM) n=1 Tax=Arboricoccus pini TaxID=1963835 RepID=A0A212RD51_9PROT|nr:TIGR02186 family protein [Arboricoccus pini]SNB70149.1 conserved hypothetical protein [Arboricoccus pini]
MRPSARPRLLLFSLLALAVFCIFAPTLRAAGLIADLSHHLVAITTAFAGSDVLVFGTTGGPDRDVVVTVQGPAGEAMVQQKSRVGGLWLSTARVTFSDVPLFYAVASTRPLAQLQAPDELARNQIGVDMLKLQPIVVEGTGDRRVGQFRDALIRRKEQAGLFQAEVRPVTFIGDRLFRTTLSFPANVPPGAYQVRTFEFENGLIVSAQTNSLSVSKVGLEAELFNLAHLQSWLYGLTSVALAVAAGWAASALFRKA